MNEIVESAILCTHYPRRTYLLKKGGEFEVINEIWRGNSEWVFSHKLTVGDLENIIGYRANNNGNLYILEKWEDKVRLSSPNYNMYLPIPVNLRTFIHNLKTDMKDFKLEISYR